MLADNGRLVFLDAKGGIRSIQRLDERGAASLQLYDSSGRAVFTAPKR